MTEQMVAKWKSDVYHLLPMCNVDIKSRLKFSASVFYIFLEVHLILMYNARSYSNFLYFMEDLNQLFVLCRVLCPQQLLKILKFMLLYYFYEHKDIKKNFPLFVNPSAWKLYAGQSYAFIKAWTFVTAASSLNKIVYMILL